MLKRILVKNTENFRKIRKIIPYNNWIIFRNCRKIVFWIQNFWNQKPPSDQDGANQKKVLPYWSSRSGVIKPYTHRQT